MTNNHVDILLVEDNANDAELALRALKQNKITNNITVVEDGEQALDFIFSRNKYSTRDTQPKVVLLDLKLPKINGLEVLKEVKANEKTKAIPIVVLTSSNEEPDLEECYKLGVNSYIRKPVEFDAFVKAVKELGLYWVLLNQPPVAE